MKPNKKLLAVFAYIDDVVQAIEKLKLDHVDVETVYAPAHNAEIHQALGLKPSAVRRFVLAGGIVGIFSGLALAMYTASQWNFIVWGKPPIPRVPYVVVAFEFCILFAILAGLIGLLTLTRLPRVRTPAHFDARFTVDRFGMLLSCPPERIATTKQLLQQTGAEDIRDVTA